MPMGSVLGDSFWDTSFTNNIVGPQVGIQWVNERQRWRIQTDARFMSGYNIANWNQIGLMGEELIPGAREPAVVRSADGVLTRVARTRIRPGGRIASGRVVPRNQCVRLTSATRARSIGGIKRAAPSVQYSLPDMGYVDTGTQNLLINGLDFGVEFVH